MRIAIVSDIHGNRSAFEALVKAKYYLERRDPDFDAKMRDVLLVCQEVALQNEKRANGEFTSHIVTVSVDEKPGLQAIANTAPDLPPVPGEHPAIGRDHEYISRMGADYPQQHRLMDSQGLGFGGSATAFPATATRTGARAGPGSPSGQCLLQQRAFLWVESSERVLPSTPSMSAARLCADQSSTPILGSKAA